jgi:hypothetical protein
MTALQVVGKVITMALTTEQTRELYIVMIPSGGSPTIAPALQHLHDLSNSTLSQGPKNVLQKESAPEIKGEGLEQGSEPLLNGILNTVLMFDGY